MELILPDAYLGQWAARREDCRRYGARFGDHGSPLVAGCRILPGPPPVDAAFDGVALFVAPAIQGRRRSALAAAFPPAHYRPSPRGGAGTYGDSHHLRRTYPSERPHRTAAPAPLREVVTHVTLWRPAQQAQNLQLPWTALCRRRGAVSRDHAPHPPHRSPARDARGRGARSRRHISRIGIRVPGHRHRLRQDRRLDGLRRHRRPGRSSRRWRAR